MTRALACRAALGGCLLGLLAVSCNSARPPYAEVEGTARLNGKPLANVQVEFWPEANGPRSLGVTDARGHYELASIEQEPGAMVGTHRVIVYDLQVYSDKPAGEGRDKEEVLK